MVLPGQHAAEVDALCAAHDSVCVRHRHEVDEALAEIRQLEDALVGAYSETARWRHKTEGARAWAMQERRISVALAKRNRRPRYEASQPFVRTPRRRCFKRRPIQGGRGYE